MPDGRAGTIPAGGVLEQYTYEPYGEIAAVESFAPHAVNRVGHQGLFFDRFDGYWTDATLAPGAAGLYYNRNRSYSPALGRFMQRDPNETALPILAALWMNAQSAELVTEGFNALTQYADGMNLYGYQRSNPLRGTDPKGLTTYAEIGVTMFTQGLLGALMGGAVTKALGGSFWEGAVGGAAAGVAGGAMAAFAESAFAASLSGLLGTLARSGYTVLGVSGFAGGSAMSLYRDRNDYGAAVANGFMGAALSMALGNLAVNLLGGFACFPADTPIVMADGTLKPIAAVVPGDLVQCSPDPENNDRCSVGMVTERLRRQATEIVTLTIEANGVQADILATPGHPIYSRTDHRYVRAGAIKPGTCLATLAGGSCTLIHTTCRADRTEVYNLVVENGHNFSVGGTHLLVHNGCEVAIIGARAAGRSVPYLLNTATGDMFLGVPGELHLQLYTRAALPAGANFSNLVGGFARLGSTGLLEAADLASGTFSGTQAMREVAAELIRSAIGK